MKIEFYCDSGANIHYKYTEVVNLEEWGISDDEWVAMSDEEKYEMANEWATNNGLEIGYIEV